MKLSVSNIAWRPDDDARVAAELQRLGVEHLEIAPTKVFPDPTHVAPRDCARYVRFWDDHGISIGSFQSLLFGHPDLQLFGRPAVRAEMTERLCRFLDLASRLGAKHLVFGSPKNRRVPKNMSTEQADEIATAFFGDLASRAIDTGTVLCIEPNPVDYDCNYVTSAEEGASLVRRVDSMGFRLHLDTAAMHLAGDNLHRSITQARDVLAHFHASAPQLGLLEDGIIDHASAGRALREIGYAGQVAIEMRESGNGSDVQRVVAAIAIARQHYEAS